MKTVFDCGVVDEVCLSYPFSGWIVASRCGSLQMVAKYLSELFENHGVPCMVDQDWVFPNSQLPAIRAVWYPGESNGGELDAI
jgi:hypothetical protein